VDYNVPIFNPFKQRGDSFYHPGNEPAICLMQIQFTYEDIAKLFEIIGQQRDKYAQTLLCKYVIIELLSLDRFVQRLASLIISGGLDFPAKSEEMTEVKAFYKRYKDARNHHFLTFKTLRDKIGAHRDPLPFEEIAASLAQGRDADAVTASGGGLDPHISPEYAALQIARVARARQVPPEAALGVRTFTASPRDDRDPRSVVEVFETLVGLPAGWTCVCGQSALACSESAARLLAANDCLSPTLTEWVGRQLLAAMQRAAGLIEVGG